MHSCRVARCALSAAQKRKPANVPVVAAVVLGSTIAELSGTQRLSIHGARACGPACVSWRDIVVFEPFGVVAITRLWLSRDAPDRDQCFVRIS